MKKLILRNQLYLPRLRWSGEAELIIVAHLQRRMLGRQYVFVDGYLPKELMVVLFLSMSGTSLAQFR